MSTGPSRREFLRAAAGVALALPTGFLFARRALAEDAKPKPLKILVLGGTGQTGPHFIERAIARGHTVTMLNRGNRSEEMFPDVENIIGDRDLAKADGLDALKAAVADGRTWDVAVDIWPQIPRMVETTAELLKPAVGRYMFVSSISVYTDNATPNQDESGPVGEAPDADNQQYTDELFGPFKAECENRVRRIYPDTHTIIRPGLIVGPRDRSYRGVYWPNRVRAGGDVLAPPAEDRIQVIDGRDLVAFQVVCLERGTNGTFNATGPNPSTPMTVRSMLETCKEVSGSDATIVYMDAEFLAEHGVGPWQQLPCWLPSEGDTAGFATRSIDKAVAAGLTFRPWAQTVRDTYAWWDVLGEESRAKSLARGFGVPKEQEAEVIAAWRAAHPG